MINLRRREPVWTKLYKWLPRPVLGFNQAIGSAAFLLVAWFWTRYIIQENSGNAGNLVAEIDWFWIEVEIALKTGIFWLIGGIGSLIYWPVVLLQFAARAMKSVFRKRN